MPASLNRKFYSFQINLQGNSDQNPKGYFGEESDKWILIYMRESLIAQLVKNPPAMQETPVRFLGEEDLLEEG